MACDGESRGGCRGGGGDLPDDSLAESAQAKRIDPLSPGRVEIFGLDITCGARRVVLSSDLGSLADLMPALAAPCDVLVCELSHYLPEELFSVLQGRTIRHLLFNHLAPELNGREVGLLGREGGVAADRRDHRRG